ncbi:MAG TPA: hypothetical protein DCE42_21565 [Myxococcales bacterium]|mgnify:CR=1 FL=1|nr:hypothetical protein [Deltaproteobacteria bacterium]HAA57369.1 hypothetical protein [Myxococcales bacterium]
MKEKRCVAYIRVSTIRQAEEQEGSLANQLHRIERYIEAKNGDGIVWRLDHVYREEGISGKDIEGRPQLQKLLRDMELGKFDVVIFTELSRISRSGHDFLGLTDIFKDHNVEFISLRENFDTTSATGRLITTVLVALAQFEREQTVERVRAGMRARAERGLYNGGGQVYGYDLDPERKGYLFINEKEAQVVKELFGLYLEKGSIAEVTKELNERGYRTKEYTTRQGNFKPAEPFVWGTIRNVLRNPAYIAKKGVNVKNRDLDQSTLSEEDRYRLVEAVWEPLIDIDTFSQVQSQQDFSCGPQLCPHRFTFLPPLPGVSGRWFKQEAEIPLLPPP